MIGERGLFCALYTDRGSHYFYTPKAGEAVDKSRPTQVGRALNRLGIEHIAAYSPEARGRSERMFGTLQDRLPKELKLAGIYEIEAANRFIREVFSQRALCQAAAGRGERFRRRRCHPCGRRSAASSRHAAATRPRFP